VTRSLIAVTDDENYNGDERRKRDNGEATHLRTVGGDQDRSTPEVRYIASVRECHLSGASRPRNASSWLVLESRSNPQEKRKDQSAAN
jgi:hypothetical protein